MARRVPAESEELVEPAGEPLAGATPWYSGLGELLAAASSRAGSGSGTTSRQRGGSLQPVTRGRRVSVWLSSSMSSPSLRNRWSKYCRASTAAVNGPTTAPVEHGRDGGAQHEAPTSAQPRAARDEQPTTPRMANGIAITWPTKRRDQAGQQVDAEEPPELPARELPGAAERGEHTTPLEDEGRRGEQDVAGVEEDRGRRRRAGRRGCRRGRRAACCRPATPRPRPTSAIGAATTMRHADGRRAAVSPRSGSSRPLLRCQASPAVISPPDHAPARRRGRSGRSPRCRRAG